MIEPNTNDNINEVSAPAVEPSENIENITPQENVSAPDITEGKSLVDIFDEADAPADNPPQDEPLDKHFNPYYEDELEERDYRPIRFSRSGRLGCLGGIMYATFILCLSVAFACFAWMAACDVLALNKGDIKMSIVISDDYFSEEEVDVFDEEGNIIGSETVLLADISSVSQLLRDSGIIEYPWLFKIFAQVSNADKKIDPGTYELSTRYDYRALVKNLQQTTGTKEIKSGVTFPEGYTMAQIFNKLESEGVCTAADLYDAAANYHYDFSFLDDSTLGDARRLEGFIFPNTYDFYVGESASSVISKFLNTFHRQLYADMYQLCDNLGITFYEAVIIASMIEKEAANDEERPIIASVIYNRLRAGISLGIDASILYVHPEHVGVQIPIEILQEDSPYNTHIYTGLPPTPICNPGLASLEAALHPSATSYYYYALDTATGTHKFFYNYNDFLNFTNTQDYDNYTP
ncbi:MAG: endolytic transglycosylase MltG [Oscillospiraceae bacterium]|nr:endolytic transglycosylase MltG [Oscillospiraceae bacterium]